jgi:hypothetical protein
MASSSTGMKKRSIVDEDDPFEALAKLILEHSQRAASLKSSSVDVDSENGSETEMPEKPKDKTEISFGPVPRNSIQTPFFFNKAAVVSKPLPQPELTDSLKVPASKKGPKATNNKTPKAPKATKKTPPPSKTGLRSSRATNKQEKNAQVSTSNSKKRKKGESEEIEVEEEQVVWESDESHS